MVRSGMVDSMNQDYVRTAWAKGLPDWVITRTHIRRNALLPAATVIGTQLIRVAVIRRRVAH